MRPQSSAHLSESLTFRLLNRDFPCEQRDRRILKTQPKMDIGQQ